MQHCEAILRAKANLQLIAACGLYGICCVYITRNIAEVESDFACATLRARISPNFREWPHLIDTSARNIASCSQPFNALVCEDNKALKF